jgi:DHA3 family tetracycline resistance protein-like MFS transporter
MHNYEGLDRAGGFATSGLLAPLRERDFLLLWTGLTVSLLGDGVFVVAVAWQAYELSDSPTALSIIMLAMTLPHVLLLLFGGVVSDRSDRRTVMLVSDVVRGGALAVAGLLAVSGTLTIGRLGAVAAVYGAGTAFFGPAFDAIVPDIVPRALWPQANALEQLVKPLTLRMMGPALGGGIIALGGTGTAFLFDAATFVASACTIWALRTRPQTDRHVGSLTTELAEGLVYVRSKVWLWGTFASAAFAYMMFMGPVEVLLPFIVKEEMQRSAGELGLVFAVGGVGSIAAAVVMGSRRQPRRSITFIYITWTLSTLTLVGYGLASTVWLLLIPSFLFNLLESGGTIVWSTLKQEHVPPHLLGRVSSLDWLISIGLMPVSFALTGPVSALFGKTATLVGAGILGAGVTLAALYLPGMRDLERSDASARVEGVVETV